MLLAENTGHVLGFIKQSCFLYLVVLKREYKPFRLPLRNCFSRSQLTSWNIRDFAHFILMSAHPHPKSWTKELYVKRAMDRYINLNRHMHNRKLPSNHELWVCMGRERPT